MEEYSLEEILDRIQDIANESIDLEEFQESLEEFIENFEYALEDDDGMSTGTKVALGVGGAGAAGAAGYLTYKHLSKEKIAKKGIMHHVKRAASAAADFGKQHWKKIAGVAGVGAVGYGAAKVGSGVSDTASRLTGSGKLAYHGIQTARHATAAMHSDTYHDAGEHLSKAMYHTDKAKREAALHYKKGHLSKEMYKGMLADHAHIKSRYHLALAEMHTEHARNAETAEEAKKHADMAAHHAELGHSAAEEAEKFDRHGGNRFEGLGHKMGGWKTHLLKEIHHLR